MVSVLLEDLNGLKAYSPRGSNSFFAGMRAVENKHSQVMSTVSFVILW